MTSAGAVVKFDTVSMEGMKATRMHGSRNRGPA